jgi:cardiolipin synthase
MDFNINPGLAWFLVAEWIIRVAMLLIVPRRRKPSSANAWLLLIMVLPTIGTLIYYMFGNPKLPKVRRARRRQVDMLTERELKELRKSHPDLFPIIKNEDRRTLARLATVLGGIPPMNGNEIELLTDYDESLSELRKEIKNAKKYIHIEYFIVAFDDSTKSIFSEIEKAVSRGVKVRFLYDELVSRHYPRHRILKKTLNRIGVDYRSMLPLNLIPGKNFTRPDLRNHRKIVVIDGNVAFSGSQNLIDKTYHRSDGIYYEEVVLKARGPIVWQYNNIFRADWFAETDEALLELVEDGDIPKNAGNTIAQVLPSGPAHEHDNNLKFYTSMVHSAKQRVGIVVPYFIPDESFLDALTAASQRGVAVTMINSESIDKLLAGHAQRSYYDELLEAGVDLYLYKKPVFLHAKQILIDDDVAILGSSNLDIRSFELDLEITTVIYDKSAVAKLEKIEKSYMKKSVRITHSIWQKRSFRLKIMDTIARLTAAFQ